LFRGGQPSFAGKIDEKFPFLIGSDGTQSNWCLC